MNIIVEQFSGLGNQMFQYAAGCYIAKKLARSKLSLIVSAPNTAASYGYPRPFLLPAMGVTAPHRKKSLLERVMLTRNPKYNLATSILRKMFRAEVVNDSSNSLSLDREADLHLSADTLYVVGYFQSASMVSSIASDLRTEFRFRDQPRGKNLSLQHQILSDDAAVSLHIRRGDYTLRNTSQIPLPVDYYERAITAISDQVKSPTFFVFSDEIDFARAYLPKDEKYVFVDHNNSFSAHEDLRLMSACQHHIIANSTFSWWGAWLNPRISKVVIAPNRWESLRSPSPDLLPDCWITLPV